MPPSTRLFAAIYFLGSCFVMLFASLLPSGNGIVAVFAKPWGETAVEIIAEADGRIIFIEDGAWVALTDATSHDYVTRLYQSGAGFVASSAVAFACARWSGVSLENT